MNEEKNFLKKCPTIQKGSDEFKVTEFKLQLSLGTTSAVINKIYNIQNTHVSAAFTNTAKGSIVLQAFIETGKLVDQNNLQKVVSKGFDINEDGMIFEVGFNKQIDVRTSKEYSFVMCKIAVGKSYCYSERRYKENKTELPENFDSIYLYSEEQSPQIFLHKYAIFKNYQVYPCYLIDFSIEANKQHQSLSCFNCIKNPPNPAKYYCLVEDCNFCVDCDIECHSSKAGQKHKRADISERPKKFGKCLNHSSDLELYCPNCSEPLCVTCKISGDHAKGEMAQHELLKLKDAYLDISSKVKDNDPRIDNRKNQLTEDLSRIDMKIKQVNNKATHVEQQIYAHFYKAIEQLKLETQKKLSFLIGDQLELKRQYDQIQWMESFLKYSLEVQQPHQFLHSWYKYSKYKKQVLNLSNLVINTDVKADMKLEGSMHVIVESKKRKIVQNANSDMIGNKEHMPALNFETPLKSNQNHETSYKDVGSTQLRKTLFQKHYSDRGKPSGQPNLMKGNFDSRSPFSNDVK